MPRVFDANHVAFRLIPKSQFSCKHLEEYPVWAEFYDDWEREEILGWGIDEVWLDQEFDKHHDGSDHAMYPLLDVNPFPTRVRIYVRARFRTPAGQNLLGCLILKRDAPPVVIAITYDGQEFSFSNIIPDWANKNKEALKRLLPDPEDPVFPIVYETDFTDEAGRTIEGAFDLTAA
jgi:hypothetical protein